MMPYQQMQMMIFLLLLMIIEEHHQTIKFVSSVEITTYITSFCVGSDFSCMVLDSNRVQCFGDTHLSSSSSSDFSDEPSESTHGFEEKLVDIEVGTGNGVAQMTCGDMHICMRLDAGDMKCLGNNENGQIGIVSDVETTTIDTVSGSDQDALHVINLGSELQVLGMALGYQFSCALLTGNKVKCIGKNDVGQLGYGDTANKGLLSSRIGDKLHFIDLGAGVEVSSIHSSSSASHVCVILSKPTHSTQRFKCWGFNNQYQLGYDDQNHRGDEPGEMGDKLLLVDLGSESKVKQIVLGGAHTCALLVNDGLKCFGSDLYGQIASGLSSSISSTGNAMPPVLVDSEKTVKLISAGQHHTCIVYDDMVTMKCIGRNSQNQLRQGDTRNRGVSDKTIIPFIPPIQLGTGSLKIKSVHSGRNFNCVVFEDSSSKCFGKNYEVESSKEADVEIILVDEAEELERRMKSRKLTVPTINPTNVSSRSPTDMPTCSPFTGIDVSLFVYRDDFGSLNWTEAEAKCQQLYNGHLATISSIGEATYLASLATEDFWIGFNDIQNEGTFVWKSGSPSTYTRWDDDEPSSDGGNENCVIVYGKGKWNDVPCEDKKLAFACDIPQTKSPTVPSNSPTKAPYVVRSLSTFAYVISPKPLSWNEAEARCQFLYNSHLATLSNNEEMAMLNTLANGTSYHIGLNDKQTEGIYAWISESTSSFTNWDDDEPNSYLGTDEDCVLVQANGKWNDIPCDDDLTTAFVCDKVESVTARPTTKPSTSSTQKPTTNPTNMSAKVLDIYSPPNADCYQYTEKSKCVAETNSECGACAYFSEKVLYGFRVRVNFVMDKGVRFIDFDNVNTVPPKTAFKDAVKAIIRTILGGDDKVIINRLGQIYQTLGVDSGYADFEFFFIESESNRAKTKEFLINKPNLHDYIDDLNFQLNKKMKTTGKNYITGRINIENLNIVDLAPGKGSCGCSEQATSSAIKIQWAKVTVMVAGLILISYII